MTRLSGLLVMKWTILSFFACVFVVVAETAPTNACVTMRECETPIRDENLFAHQESLLIKVVDENMLDRVCGKVATTTDCISKTAEHCKIDFIQMDTLLFKDLVSYICTPAGRQVALATGKTSCVIDSKLEKRFQYVQLACVSRFVTDIEKEGDSKGRPLTNDEACGLKANLDQCVKDGMDKLCGEQMAAFVGKMWEFWNDYAFSEYNCALIVDSSL